MFPKRVRWRLTFFCFMGVIASGTLLVTESYREYHERLRNLRAQLDAEARLLAEHLALSIHATELVMQRAAAELNREGMENLAGDRAYYRTLRQTLRHAPQLAAEATATHMRYSRSGR